jgi:hypothetical protein
MRHRAPSACRIHKRWSRSLRSEPETTKRLTRDAAQTHRPCQPDLRHGRNSQRCGPTLLELSQDIPRVGPTVRSSEHPVSAPVLQWLQLDCTSIPMDRSSVQLAPTSPMSRLETSTAGQSSLGQETQSPRVHPSIPTPARAILGLSRSTLECAGERLGGAGDMLELAG